MKISAVLISFAIPLFSCQVAAASGLSDAPPGSSIRGETPARALAGWGHPPILLAMNGKGLQGMGGGKRGQKFQQQQPMEPAKPCVDCVSLDGFVPPGDIPDDIRKMVGKFMGDQTEAVAIQKSRGGIETGLEPDFIDGGTCPEIDSETWAIDYTNNRGRPGAAIHKGIDIPQPRGTPILAIADGVVVGKFRNERNRKGIEIMLRHRPEQTGLDYWTYSQYTHLEELPSLPIGAEVRMGDEIGKTHNTGKSVKGRRRDALHFAILYSDSPHWSNDGRFVLPKDSYWMDPNAFYRERPPYDSQSVAALPADQKAVPVAYMRRDGSIVPEGARRIWPYACD